MLGSGVTALPERGVDRPGAEPDMPGLKTNRPAKANVGSVEPFQALLVENDNLLLKILLNSLRPGR